MDNFSYKIINDDIIFALDIGTRTVIGIICKKENGKLIVKHCEIKEHESRAMLDGQVHDIAKVAHTVEIVKEKLEEKSGINLNKVAIAAAGRVLQTKSVKVELPLDSMQPITKEIIRSLEIEGIKKAQAELKRDTIDDMSDFYCVGYSVINYFLNGYIISNPMDHKGKLLSADLLATFLPQTVIDSLYAVTDKVGLQVISLTLEPIAAINVAIPEDLRLLNLALVDIGAGTSDIAITKDGAIVAYGMVPVAGDEITEKIVQNYLVDFNTAEKVKLSMGKEEPIRFIDILGTEYEVTTSELERVIKPAVDNLADEIGSKILEYNEKSPNAVFCVGGGSLSYGLTNALAKKLNLAPPRVAVRDRASIKEVEFEGDILNGPDVVTVIGIGKTADQQIGHDFIYISVDNKPIRLFKVKDIKIADVLAFTGFDPKELIGRTGKSLTFTLNGVKKIVHGECGISAEISLNGALASLDSFVKDEDQIIIKPAVNGKDGKAKLRDYVNGLVIKRITLDTSFMDISTKVMINGKVEKSIDTPINSEDKIDIVEINTLEDLSKAVDYNTSGVDFFVNGKMANYDYVLKDGDRIDVIPKKGFDSNEIVEKIEEVKNSESFVTSNNKNEELLNDTQGKNELLEENSSVPEKTDAKPAIQEKISESFGFMEHSFYVLVNGQKIYLEGKDSYIFVDIFNYIDFDLSKPQGTILLQINGRKARYTEKLNIGDDIVVAWT